MSKVIDITSKLTNDRPKLKVTDDLEFEIDNRKNTIFEVEKLLNDEDVNNIAVIDTILEKLMGKKAVEELNNLELSFDSYQVIFTAAMAGAMGEDYEVAEARFREATPSQQ